MAYVSEYGNYGAERILVFDSGDLNEEHWNILSELPDHDKLPFVDALLNNEPTDRWRA